jgi:hypothetical protein
MNTDSETQKPKSLVCAIGSETTSLQDDEIRSQLHKLLDALGEQEEILLLPVCILIPLNLRNMRYLSI